MTKVDKILISALLVASIILMSIMALGSHSNKKVVVEVRGVLYGEYDINIPKEIDVNITYGYNKIKIDGKSVSVIQSSCFHECERQKISQPGQTIICLPNYLIIRIVGSKNVDEVAY